MRTITVLECGVDDAGIPDLSHLDELTVTTGELAAATFGIATSAPFGRGGPVLHYPYALIETADRLARLPTSSTPHLPQARLELQHLIELVRAAVGAGQRPSDS